MYKCTKISLFDIYIYLPKVSLRTMWYVSQKCRIDQYDTFGISILECLGFSQKCRIDQYDTFGVWTSFLSFPKSVVLINTTLLRNIWLLQFDEIFFQPWYIGKYDIASLLVKAHIPYYNGQYQPVCELWPGY